MIGAGVVWLTVPALRLLVPISELSRTAGAPTKTLKGTGLRETYPCIGG